MSLESAQAWLEKVRADSELKAKILEPAAGQPDRILDALVAAGSEAGYTFGKDDLLQAVKEAVSEIVARRTDGLDETQLESVAGGVSEDVIAYSFGSFGFGCLVSWLQGCDLEEEAKKANRPPGPYDPSY